MMKFFKHKLTIAFLLTALAFTVIIITSPQVKAHKTKSTKAATSELILNYDSDVPLPEPPSYVKKALQVVVAAGTATTMLADMLVNLIASKTYSETYSPTALDY